MKIRSNPFLRYSVSLAFSIAFASMAHAQNRAWTGNLSNDFNTDGNWNGTLTTNGTLQINSPGTQGNSTLNLSSPFAFTANTGKLAFGSSSGNMTLSGGDITLFQGTGGDVIRTDTTGTTTLASNIILGNGSDAGTGTVTYTLSSTSTTTGLLKVTGNISGGTKPGAVTVSFGSTDSINGNYEVTGNITKGGATAINLAKRGNGTLTLSGTNEVLSLGQNVGGSKIVIAGGKTSILQSGAQQGWSGNRADTSVKINAGAELYANDASGIRTRVVVDGGTLTIGNVSTASGMYWDVQLTAPGEVFTLNSGTVNFASTFGGSPNSYLRGFRLQANTNNQTISGSQSGGNFTVLGGSSAGNVFTIGNAAGTYTGTPTSYTLSGGTLDLKGQNGTSQGHLRIDADSGGFNTTTFTLSGNGTLISRFNPGASSGGISGGTAGAKQILDLSGGTLVAGRIDATNLRGSAGGTNGTIVNNGTNIAPGDVSAGLVGRTNIVGNMDVSTGTLTIDLGGLTASTAFSEAASGKFDNLLISGNLSLGGDLVLNLMTGYTPDFTDVFKIIDAATLTANTFFGNVADGDTLLTAGGEGTFKVYSLSGDVYLSEFTLVPEPRAALLGGLGLLALLRRRRN